MSKDPTELGMMLGNFIEAIWGFSWSWTVQGAVLEQELPWSFQKGGDLYDRP